MRLGVRWQNANRVAERGNRVFPVAAGMVGAAQIIVINGGAAVDFDGLLNGANGDFRPSLLMRRDTEQMQCVGVTGVNAQDLAINTVRCGKLTGPLMLDRLLELVMDGEHAVHSLKPALSDNVIIVMPITVI